VLDIDKRCETAALSRLRDDSKHKRCLAGRFRAEDLDYSSTRKSTNSEGAVDQNVSSRNDIDINDSFAAQTHDRTFAVIFRDLLDRQVEVLISRSSQFISGCFFFGLCRHIRKNLTTTHASIRQAQKRCPSANDNEKKAASMMLAAFKLRDPDFLRNSDLARLDVLCFWQSQRHEALIDLRADFVGVD